MAARAVRSECDPFPVRRILWGVIEAGRGYDSNRGSSCDGSRTPCRKIQPPDVHVDDPQRVNQTAPPGNGRRTDPCPGEREALRLARPAVTHCHPPQAWIVEGAPGKEEEFSIRRLRRTAGIAIAECDALRLPVGFEIIGQLAEVEVSFAYWENSGENEVVTIRG